jgi:flavin-dependent dehydrogenase
MGDPYDAIVVGASIAGCTAATLLARRGLRVALLERASDPAAYKTTCTHYVQPSATKTIERLGLAEPLAAAGAVRNGDIELCTPFGWLADVDLGIDGYNVRRETLDPMLRDLAGTTPGVTLRLGTAVKELVKDGARVAGVVADGKRDGRLELRAPLVVAADGRHSKLGTMAGVPAEVAENGRFLYLAYYERAADDVTSRIWFRNPDVCYVFPNDGGVSCVVTMPTKDKLPAFRQNLEASFQAMFRGLPRGPSLDATKRVSDFYGMLEMPNHIRRASAPGIAFVGDAAMTCDPVVGAGIGFAFQSAEWLADDVGAALLAKSPAQLDAALVTYARHHDERLRAHHAMINLVSKAKPWSPLERLLFGAAAKDARVSELMARLQSRLAHPRDVVGPGLLARALWANLTKKPLDPVTVPLRAALA